MLKNIILKYQEIISYLFWGVATAFVNWLSYGVFSFIFATVFLKITEFEIFLANVVSWTFATGFAFVTNKIFVFKKKDWKIKNVTKEISKFVSGRAVTGTFEIIAVPFLVKLGLDQTVLGVEGMLSKILVSIIVVILNYILSKKVIFKK